MLPNVSFYLDVARLLSALIVFVGHAAGRLITGSFLCQTSRYLQTAVIVLFVISGYVIGYVVNTRENSLSQYNINRLSLLYSVVIPALFITIISDKVCLIFAPPLLKQGQSEYSGDQDDTIFSHFPIHTVIRDIW
jgi:peptidoglycan/LPS O-acetylase OafA/YrhL